MVNIYFFRYWRPVHRGSLIDRLTRLVSAILLLGQTFCSTGCGGAPSITTAGAYFPAWLLCAVIAVLVAALIRTLMVATHPYSGSSRPAICETRRARQQLYCA